MRIAFQTVGCRLNQAETAEMAEACRRAGWAVVDPAGPHDVCVVHGCAITAAAERDTLRLARRARRAMPNARVVVAGCAAELDPAGVRRRTGADLVLGQAAKRALPAALAELLPAATATVTTPDACAEPRPEQGRARPPLRVQDGCDFGCAYCIVPATRPRLWSRPVADCVAAVNALHAKGYREVVLTGANLGLYAHGGSDLIALLRAILDDTSMPRIRLSSIEPTTVENRLIDVMTASPRLCRYLHLPLQSGDDGVLRRMGRRYTAQAYRAAVLRAAEALPGIGIGTDLVCGFPGETERAHEATYALIDALPLSNLHVFPYSERPGTRAATMADGVPTAERRRRARRLIALGKRKREAFAAACIGRNVSVLVERLHPDGAATGWTSEYLPARISGGSHQPNAIVTARPGERSGTELQI